MLSELMLLLGNIRAAEQYAQESVELAIRGGDWGQQVRSRCRLGAVRHMQGRLDDAEGLFREALELQQQVEPRKPVLYSDHGFLYRRFLLDSPKPDALMQLLSEAEWALDYDHRHNPSLRWLSAIALDLLSKATAAGKMAESDQSRRELALDLFVEAEETLIKSSWVIYFPELYLARADFYLHIENYDQAGADAEQALRYADDYRLALYRVDANLMKARIFDRSHEYDLAHKCLEDAETEATKLGYWRHHRAFEELRDIFRQRG